MRRLAETDVLQATPGLRCAALPGEMILLDERRGVYVGLSDVGLRIWSLIRKPRSIGEVVDRLTQEFDVERERCKRDVLEFVARLVERDLVRVHDGPLE